MTRIPLRILLVEDSDDDAILVTAALERQGFDLDSRRVMTAESFASALGTGDFDVILCDYSMPAFGAFEALEILRRSGKDIPLIIVSGAIGEETAVDAMRSGAVDYISKNNLVRLGVAVDREIRDCGIRRQKRVSDTIAKSQGEVLEMIISGNPLHRILERIADSVRGLSGATSRCAIMLADPRTDQLVLGAESGFEDGFFESLGPFPAVVGMTPGGTAAVLGNLAIFDDIPAQSDWDAFRRACTETGLRTCWAMPVMSAERAVLGILDIYFPGSRSPSEEETRWLESASQLASLAIERSRASEQLRESEALLRIASEAARIGGWIVEFPDRRITWSDQVCSIHEVPPGTSPGLDEALGYFCAEWRQTIARLVDRCSTDGEPFDVETGIITARGQRLWVRLIGEAIRDETGRIARIQGALEDISDRKAAVESLRANEQRYRTQRNALIALTRETQPETLDIGQAFLRITETTARTLGVERVSVWRFTDDRQRIECLDLYELAAGRHTSGQTLVAEDYPHYFACLETMELIAADDAVNDPGTREFSEGYLLPLGIGSMMDVPVRLGEHLNHLLCCEHVGPMRIWTADEKTFAVAAANLISLSLEIRGRTLARQDALKSHQRFQLVASATNDTIWDWNLETDAFWWKDGFSNLFGWPSSENSANITHWIRQIHPDDRKHVVSGILVAIRGSENQWTDEYRFVSNDGTISYVMDRGNIIRNEAGRAIRMVGGMMDMTEVRAAERELARSHRALRMLGSCNEMLLSESDESSLLEEACRIAVEIGGYRVAWVGYFMEGELGMVVPMAHAGDEIALVSEINVACPGDPSSGEVDCANHLGAYSSDRNEGFFPCCEEHARKCGYTSAICLPLITEGRKMGVFCLYSMDSDPLAEDEIHVLREMANDLSLGIASIRSREVRKRTEEVIIKVAQTVSGGAGSEFFDLLTENMVEALGARFGLIGRLDPDTSCVETISCVADGERIENFRYNLAGTPCADVAEGRICVLERGVRCVFPDNHVLSNLEIESYAGIPLRDQTGAVSGIMAVFFSTPLHETSLITSTLRIFSARASSELDRQMADARIREQASLLDKARDAILVRDLDHQITYWNKSAERLYGWAAEEVINRSVADLLYHDATAYQEAHEKTLHSGEWVGELTQVDRSGREIIVEGRWSLLTDDSGRPRGVLAINTDISEYRRLERQFVRAQRLESIGILAGGIAHDLNNILTPISMAVELLRMRGAEGRSLELLETIASSAKRGANMVGRVLSFARGVEGRHVRFHPRRIISEVESILRDTFPRSIELAFSAERDLWLIDGDPTQMHQVLLNLCVNASDAISGPGSITVSAENVHVDASFAASDLDASEGSYVCLRVSDTGVGISPDIIDRIFDPFFTTKAMGKGTGLGLPTTLGIVKSHGGFIRITSKPGEGTVAKVFIPAFPEADDAAGQLEIADLPHGRGETVLVVDDEEPIRRIACETLEKFGYKTLSAPHGRDGLDIYQEMHTSIAVVVTDLMMPVMDGREMIPLIRRINPDARIIATSGVAPGGESPQSGIDGISCFLAKPYSAEGLLKCLRLVLDVPDGDSQPPCFSCVT